MTPLYYTLKQCDEVTFANISMPYMKSYYSCLNRMIGEGYTDEFKPTVKGLQSKRTSRIYRPVEITIVNVFKFNGNANPADDVTMYIIETSDGNKGTLISSSSTYNENIVASMFLSEAEAVQG